MSIPFRQLSSFEIDNAVTPPLRGVAARVYPGPFGYAVAALQYNTHSVLATMAASDLLSYVRSQVTVDVDSMDPAVAARHTSDTAKFSDMTSNQAIVFGEASKSDRADLLREACALAARNNASNLDLQVDNALDILVCVTSRLS